MAVVLALVLGTVHAAFPQFALGGLMDLFEVGPAPAELPETGLFYGLWDYKFEDPPTPEMVDNCEWAPENPESPYSWLFPAEFIQDDDIVTTADGAERCGYPQKEWPRLLETAIHWFGDGARDYATNDETDGDDPPAVYVAYGLLNTQIHWGGSDENFTEQFRRVVFPSIYNSPVLMEAMYHWAMPAVERAFNRMPEDQQFNYLSAFYYARKYLADFDYEAELSYYNRLERGECQLANDGSADDPYNNCPSLFTREDGSGRKHSYRKLEAFVFRRVHFDHVPVQTLNLWLNRVIMDLSVNTRGVVVDSARLVAEGIQANRRAEIEHVEAEVEAESEGNEKSLDSPPEGLPEFKIFDSVSVRTPPKDSPCRFYRVYAWGDRDYVMRDSNAEYYPAVGQTVDKYWEIPARELERCKYTPLNLSWTEVVETAIGKFQWTDGSEETNPEFQRELLVAYGLLQTGGGTFGGGDGVHETFRRKTLPLLYRSPALLEATYRWVKPTLLAKFVEMSPEYRAIYLEILAHGERYLAGFNYQRERAYLARLERGQCDNDPKPEWWKRSERPCLTLFTIQGPNGRANPYRKLEAWIFRRAHTDKVPVSVMRHWIRRFRTDLEEAHRTAAASTPPTP